MVLIGFLVQLIQLRLFEENIINTFFDISNRQQQYKIDKFPLDKFEPVRTQSIPSSAFPFYLRNAGFHIPSDSCPRPYPNGIMMSHKLLPLFVSTLFLVFIEQSLWFPVTLDTAEPRDGWIFPSITGSGYGPSVTLLAQGGPCDVTGPIRRYCLIFFH